MPIPEPGDANVAFAHLRAQTADAHRRIDSHPIGRALASGSLPLPDYLAILAHFGRRTAMIVAHIGPLDSLTQGLDALGRDLGAPVEAAPVDSASPSAHTWFGAAWVITGSARGARVMLGPLEHRYGPERTHYYRHHASHAALARRQLIALSTSLGPSSMPGVSGVDVEILGAVAEFEAALAVFDSLVR